MLRTTRAAALMLALTTLAISHPALAEPAMAGQQWKVGIRLLAGAGPAAEALRDVRSYHAFSAESFVFEDDLDSGRDFLGAQLLLTSQSGWGFSVGVASGSGRYEDRFDFRAGETDEFHTGDQNSPYLDGDVRTHSYEISALRVPISVAYLKSMGRWRVGCAFGGDIGTGTITSTERFSRADGSSSSHKWSGDGSGFGMHVGGEVGLRVSRTVGLFVHAEYLSMTLKSFIGNGLSVGPLGAERYPARAVSVPQDPGIELVHNLNRGGDRFEFDASGLRVMMGLTAYWPW